MPTYNSALAHKFNPEETPQNSMLAALPRSEYQRLAPHIKPVHLPFGQSLYEDGDAVARVYFPTSGMISLVLTDKEGKDVEVGLVAHEGVAGLNTILTGEPSKFRTQVQMEGTALAIPIDVVREEFKRGGALQESLLYYSEALLMQASQAALCNVRHSVEERLCRWLLTVADRVGTDEFNITQELLATMLGVRRSGVTVTAGSLKAAGLLDYTRGHICLLDRAGLESTACECFGIVRDHFKHLVD
jgi:CRP-like cAMP-binding protein